MGEGQTKRMQTEVGTKGVGVRKLLKHSRKQIEGQRRHSKRWWGKERQEGRWGGGGGTKNESEQSR